VRPGLVLVGTAGVYAAFGLLANTTGALVPLIQADLGLSDGRMGLVLGAWQLLYIVTSIPAGRLIDRFGARRALIVCMVVMLASGLLRAAAVGFTTLFLAVGLMGVGAPIISAGAPKVAASLFEGSARRRAVAVYSTAPALGAMLGLALPTNVIGPLVDQRWRPITVVITVAAGASLLVWLAVSRRLDEVMVPGGGPELSDYRSIAALPVVRYVLGLSVLTFFFIHGVGQWLVGIMASSGWTDSQAGLLAALAGFGALSAGFAVPRMATPARRPALIIGSLLLGAAALPLLVSTSGPVVVAGLAGMSPARSALMPLYMLTLMDHPDVGPERMAAATGLFFTTAQFGGVAGPATTGFLSDLSGGFGLPLAVHSGVMVVTAIAVGLQYRRVIASTSVGPRP
jgi:predicted MFS family arabinose efflux permease